MSLELSGHLSGHVHIFPVRVYYEDTDATGLVYYASYMKFIERARTEMMRHVGLSHSSLKAETDAAFIVRHCRLDYRIPAHIDDLLEVHTRIVRLSGASIGAEQIVKRDGDELVRVDLKIACVDSSGRALRLPGRVRDALFPFVEPDPPQARV